ncbi:MAG: hypothetical protein K8W52_18490 [Deltaproteobacteria bacterium]|nr:hypothetical protein [Deltaproteobacteria bacterium]
MIGRVVPLLLVAAAAAGCDDFATPAQLTKPTVLAVIADPPIVAPGASAAISVAMAGPDGPIAGPTVTWSLAETYPGIAPFGTITPTADGAATYAAPDPLPPLPDKVPPVVTIQAAIGGDTPITALMAIGVVAVPSANPVIDALTVAGATGDTATITHGATVDVAAMITPAADDTTSFAWYSTAGEIERYQSNPTTLVAPAEPGSGWIYVVVRDGKGGAAVRSIAVTIN